MADHDRMRELLDRGGFESLFRNELMWDNPPDELRREELDATEVAPDVPVIARCVAEKRGVMVWVIDVPEIPSRAEQYRRARELRKWSSDHLVIFAAPTEHLWLWPEQRPSGTGWRLVDHQYRRGERNDPLLQRLDRVRFGIREKLTGPQVLYRVRQSFNVDKVTKRFYTEFQKHHKALTERIEGIPAHRDRDRRWYASVLMNRLMFIYFVQRKQFLDQDTDYLRTRLNQVRETFVEHDSECYFGTFLLPLFHQGLGTPPGDQTWDDPMVRHIVGSVPYVNGGIFERHDLERDYEIWIPDVAFESLFDFFDQWRWHLDERPSGAPNEINPDILGFIFERYVNYTEAGQRENGAYYTKPDVTGYMSVSTIIPAVVDRLTDRGLEDPCVLLPNTGSRYLHSVLGHGREVDLPEGDLQPGEYPDSALDIALPGERWCDVVHRRERFRELEELVDGGGVENIDDAVTANLDLPGLMEDYLSQMTADECEVAFEVLRSLTVCDPAVGSGAFLLSALDVLEPMYTVVLDRAREIADTATASPQGWTHVPQFVTDAEKHPNDRYWLLKTICLNNLYGVDLMGEAAEIAKLRLFLKLVAQLKNVTQIEPLPDLDFNIKSGNLLVGIAHMEDANQRFTENLLQMPGIEGAEHAAKQAAEAYDRFVTGQLADSGTGAAVGKQRLTTQIRAAAAQADVALYDMREEQSGLDAWKESHTPFHWFAEFPSVWRSSGFDVIIGNPPYIGKKRITEYVWRGYETQSCPDLYAVCTERASTLLNPDGRLSFIVPHSLSFSQKYILLRDYMRKRFPVIWSSSYSRRPTGLFSGSSAVRNTIVTASRSSLRRPLITTELRRWESDYRPHLFSTLAYAELPVELTTVNGQWPFAPPGEVTQVFAGMCGKEVHLQDSFCKDDDAPTLGYKTTALYRLSPYIDEPPVFDKNGNPSHQTKGAWLPFRTEAERDVAYLILAGRWGFLWWALVGDDFDVTKRVIGSFPIDLAEAVGTVSGPALVKMARQLRAEAPQHLFWIRKAGRRVGNYDMEKLRHITDKADAVLADILDISAVFKAAGAARERRVWPQQLRG